MFFIHLTLELAVLICGILLLTNGSLLYGCILTSVGIIFLLITFYQYAKRKNLSPDCVPECFHIPSCGGHKHKHFDCDCDDCDGVGNCDCNS